MTRELLKRARDLIAEYIDVPGEDWSHVHCDEDAGGNHNLDLEWLEQDMLQLVREIDEALAADREPDLMCGHPVGTFGHVDGCPDDPGINPDRLAHAMHIAEGHCDANAYHCVEWKTRQKRATRAVNVYDSLAGSYP